MRDRRCYPTLILAACLLTTATTAALATNRLQTGPQLAAVVDVPVGDGSCLVGQTNEINAQIGIDGPERLQGFCLPNPPGEPGDLTGFAFVLEACSTGALDDIFLFFRIADLQDNFLLYIWRDLGGVPNDTCGLEAHVSIESIQDVNLFSEYPLCDESIPVAEDERFYVGTVYRRVTEIFGPDWFMGRNADDSLPDRAFINLSGDHGDWVDLDDQGLGNRFGVFASISQDCGAVPVERTSWGTLKALMR